MENMVSFSMVIENVVPYGYGECGTMENVVLFSMVPHISTFSIIILNGTAF